MSDGELQVLASLMGRLEKTVETSFREVRHDLELFGKRVTALEEFKIRAEERGRTEDRIRAEFDRAEVRRESQTALDNQATTNRVSISLYRWQLWVAVLSIIIAVLIAVLTQVPS